MFECEIKEYQEIRNGNVPDDMQMGVEWINLKKIHEYNIYPKILKNLINKDGKIKKKIYLGDIN